MGQIRKRGGVWWIRFYRDGRRFEESARTDKYDTARDLLKTREGEVAKGAAVNTRIGRMRFEEAGKALITDYTVNKRRTLEDVTRRVNEALGPFFAGRRLSHITTADIRNYIAHRQSQGAANATINLELANLKRIFTLAMQSGMLYRPHIPMLKEDNVRKGFLEREHFDAVRKHLRAPLNAAVTLAYYTGWRTPSEILPLEWRQVDRTAKVIRLEPGTTKNREGQVFTYAALPEVHEAIEALWLRHEALKKKKGKISPRLFCRGNGEAILSFRKRWNAACEAAGCPGRILHDLRRTAVRNLVRAGVPDTICMRITGHKTRSVFDRYDIVSEEDLLDATRKLQGLVAGTNSGTTGKKDRSR